MTRAYGGAWRTSPSPQYATAGPDGRFNFKVPKAKFGEHYTVVAAMAKDHGAGWVEVPADDKRGDLTVRLVEDDMPITGQILDLEGKPVTGATLRVVEIKAAPGEDLGPWLKAAKDKKAPIHDRSVRLEENYLSRYTIALSPTATTDAEGRFRLTGIGRNRLVRAQLDGPTIASQQLHILTRLGKAIEVPRLEADREYGAPSLVITYYGASFQHVAAPTKPIIGMVRDKDTKKPLSGATVESYKLATGPFSGVDIVQTKTDAQGRYRLTGMPKGEGNLIRLVPSDNQPYVSVHAVVPDSPGLDPVKVDFEPKRGVWIEGKLTDKVTGKPEKGSVEYFSLYSNPNLRDYPGLDGTSHTIIGTEEDGSYRIVGLPGPGLVAVYHKVRYLRAPEREDEYGTKESSLNTSPYHIGFASNYAAIARVDPAKGIDSVKRDVTLDPGWSFTGTVLGPDGKPILGARNLGLGIPPWQREGMKTAEFAVHGFNQRRPREILFQHLEKGLVGIAHSPTVNGGSVTVRMEPGATMTGRLLDAESGHPRAGIELELTFRLKEGQYFGSYFPERIKTDHVGRFRIEALLPGYEFRLSDDKGELLFGDTLRSGQTKDLGNVQMKRESE
jgi:5-hydroxyisourate hydrolase-like protein (transthyretin family)